MLSFGVSGLLWNRSLVMWDAETKSLWSHILGEAKDGPMKGTKLEALSTELVTWKQWREQHPDTTVLNLSRVTRWIERGNDYKTSFYKDPSEFVFGWSVGLRRYHVPLDVLTKQPILNVTVANTSLTATFDPESTSLNLFSRRVGNQQLSFVAARPGQMRDEQTGSIWDARTGLALEGRLKGQRLGRHLGMLSYAQAWRIFYPNSTRLPPPPESSSR